MAPPRKYSPELRERAVRMVFELRAAGEGTGVLARVADQLGVHREALRTWVRQTEVDGGKRPGTSTSDAWRITELERENRELRRANEILKAASAYFRPGTRSQTSALVEFIDTHREQFGVEPICAVLEFAPSTYWAAKKRESNPSARAVRDEELKKEILKVWEGPGRGLYGARKVWGQLNRQGVTVARCTVERLMRELGLCGATWSRKRPRTTVPGADRPGDLLERNFTADRPDLRWVADITYVATVSGWVYTAFVQDLYSRRIVGWQVADHLGTDLALDALEMAIWARGDVVDNLVHHSDRGVQYTSIRYAERLDQVGAARSVGSKGDSYDNAAAESLNSLYKKELIEFQGDWKGVMDVTIATMEWVAWYNSERLHSYCGNVPPAEYEETFHRSTAGADLAIENQAI
ncbi:IS3 family transposase [Streptosporangium sp. NBC_01495]|uniref:IS3 family transposase n=1 Tax=Streptosporangium sp. NBC_01495 TaxID=2903899 RepID=UPI002E2FB713|nr:IS3 family transposase [Streptosporangium sp. NBC_01495]